MRRAVYLESLPHSVYIIAFYEIAVVSTRSARFLSRDRFDRFDARTTPPFQFPDKNIAQVAGREQHFRRAELIAD